MSNQHIIFVSTISIFRRITSVTNCTRWNTHGNKTLKTVKHVDSKVLWIYSRVVCVVWDDEFVSLRLSPFRMAVFFQSTFIVALWSQQRRVKCLTMSLWRVTLCKGWRRRSALYPDRHLCSSVHWDKSDFI